MHILLTELERFEGTCVLATNLPDMLDDALWRRALVCVHFGKPEHAARAEIWRALLPAGMPLAADVDLKRLAEIEIAGGAINNAILTAAAAAVYEAGAVASARVTQAMLEDAANAQGAGRRITRADLERGRVMGEEGGGRQGLCDRRKRTLPCALGRRDAVTREREQYGRPRSASAWGLRLEVGKRCRAATRASDAVGLHVFASGQHGVHPGGLAAPSTRPKFTVEAAIFGGCG